MLDNETFVLTMYFLMLVICFCAVMVPLAVL
jgi:hypothetical protein